MTKLIIVVGVAIIAALALYATKLLLKLKSQQRQIATIQKEKALKAQQKKDAVYADIRYIALAMLEDRCEVSEGVVRIVKLLEKLSLSEKMATEIPAIFEHYQVIASHPILEARKKLPKQARMKLDLQRVKSEGLLESAILENAKKMLEFNK